MLLGRRSRRWSSSTAGSAGREARWAWRRSARGCGSSTTAAGPRVVQCRSCLVVVTEQHRAPHQEGKRELLRGTSNHLQLRRYLHVQQTAGVTPNCSPCFSGDFPPHHLHCEARVCSPGLVNPPGLAPSMWNLLSRVAAAEAELGEVRRLLRDAVEGLQVGTLLMLTSV